MNISVEYLEVLAKQIVEGETWVKIRYATKTEYGYYVRITIENRDAMANGVLQLDEKAKLIEFDSDTFTEEMIETGMFDALNNFLKGERVRILTGHYPAHTSDPGKKIY